MTVVDTNMGRVEGFERNGVLQFRGIRYANPPVGDLRWQPPQPCQPWTGVRPAISFGPVAPQGPSPVSSIFGIADFGGKHPDISEDCLSLNVYAPARGAEHSPVMVWIHGGSFIGGSNRNVWYNGTSFAQKGVVVVTINYRLGAFGFLDLGDEEPGASNRGLLDQVAALEWVHKNIAAFGGDPANVTIFGNSAGAMCIGSLLTLPAASGLFQRAILQSGAAATFQSRHQAADVTASMTAALGSRDYLRIATWEQVVRAQGEVFIEMAGRGDGLPFMPVVDDAVLPHAPIEAISKGAAAQVRLLMGTNSDEATLFLALALSGADLSKEFVIHRLDQTSGGAGRELYDAYRSVLGASAEPKDVWVAVETDRGFRAPAIQLAAAQARQTRDVWMYLFTHESPALDGMLKSCHGLEIPFAWNTLTSDSDGFTGRGPGAQGLADEMHSAWVAFAASGDPGWDRYEEGRRATRVFGRGTGTVDDPIGARRALWRYEAPGGTPEPTVTKSRKGRRRATPHAGSS